MAERKPSIQEGTGVTLWAARQHKLSTINLHNRPPPLSIPLCRFQGWGRCQCGGWWWRTGHTVSRLSLLAIYLVKSSEAPAVHPTEGFLDWLESSENSGHFGGLHFSLNQACESWKMLVLARGEVMWTLKTAIKNDIFSWSNYGFKRSGVHVNSNQLHQRKHTHTHT